MLHQLSFPAISAFSIQALLKNIHKHARRLLVSGTHPQHLKFEFGASGVECSITSYAAVEHWLIVHEFFSKWYWVEKIHLRQRATNWALTFHLSDYFIFLSRCILGNWIQSYTKNSSTRRSITFSLCFIVAELTAGMKFGMVSRWNRGRSKATISHGLTKETAEIVPETFKLEWSTWRYR